jgi:ribonuclease-3 family protein
MTLNGDKPMNERDALRTMEGQEVTAPALAYLGDCVLEMCVRTYLVMERGLSTSAHLNREALLFVRASAQSEAMTRIEPLLDEEELQAYRRGRNIGHTNVPKSASMAEYRRATGMEALFGYLSLLGRDDRIQALFRAGYGLDDQ